MRYFQSPSAKSHRSDRTVLILGMLALAILVGVGTVGFQIMEGWGFIDSLYMTVITLSTVGFGEVLPLSPRGKLFAIFLIISGVGVVALVFTTVSQVIIEKQMAWIFGKEKMLDKIDKLSNHTILCGYGQLGRIAAQRLQEGGISPIIIDRDEDSYHRAIDDGLIAIHGDATRDEILKNAGIERASQLVTLLSTDANNLYVVLAAHDLNPKIRLVSRAETEMGEKRLLKVGVDKIISPYLAGGQKLADAVLRPYVADFLELAAYDNNIELQIEEIHIPHESPMIGQSLEESGIRAKTNVVIAAIIEASKKMSFNPRPNTVIEEGAILIALGEKEELLKLEGLLI